MPTKYEPRVRSGIVGIGDRNVLARFKEVLDNHFESERAEIPMTLEAAAGLSKSMERPFNLDFTQAVLNGTTTVAAASLFVRSLSCQLEIDYDGAYPIPSLSSAEESKKVTA